jgi:hypothetical protein
MTSGRCVALRGPLEKCSSAYENYVVATDASDAIVSVKVAGGGSPQVACSENFTMIAPFPLTLTTD